MSDPITNKSNEEAHIRGAKLLLEGASMLNLSCPVCHDPIYQLKNGQMYCANCDKKVVHEKGLEQPDKAIESESLNPIQKKIELLSKELEKETNPDKIIEIANTIKKLEQIVKS